MKNPQETAALNIGNGIESANFTSQHFNLTYEGFSQVKEKIQAAVVDYFHKNLREITEEQFAQYKKLLERWGVSENPIDTALQTHWEAVLYEQIAEVTGVLCLNETFLVSKKNHNLMTIDNCTVDENISFGISIGGGTSIYSPLGEDKKEIEFLWSVLEAENDPKDNQASSIPLEFHKLQFTVIAFDDTLLETIRDIPYRDALMRMVMALHRWADHDFIMHNVEHLNEREYMARVLENATIPAKDMEMISNAAHLRYMSIANKLANLQIGTRASESQSIYDHVTKLARRVFEYGKQLESDSKLHTLNHPSGFSISNEEVRDYFGRIAVFFLGRILPTKSEQWQTLQKDYPSYFSGGSFNGHDHNGSVGTLLQKTKLD